MVSHEETGVPSYSERHLDQAKALEYRDKFKKSLSRELSSWREKRILRQALKAAFARIPAYLVKRCGIKLLDLPCGAGRFAALLARDVAQYHAADHSPHMLELCRKSLKDAGLMDKAKSFQQLDARDMNLHGGPFDIACCLRLIHHFKDRADRARILTGFRRANKGPLVISFLNRDSIKQWRHARQKSLSAEENRRATLSAAEFGAEAMDAGYHLDRFWSLSSLFSGQCIALLSPIPDEKSGPNH